jgi:hypothetical protein
VVPAAEPPVPIDDEALPLPAVDPPALMVEAEPEPEPLPAAEPPVPSAVLDEPLPAVEAPVPSVDAEPEPEPLPAAEPPVPSEVLAEPLPAVAAPTPRVEAEPEPEAPAEEPPVPSVVLAEPLPAVEPPALKVELDCAYAIAAEPSTRVLANAAARSCLRVIVSSKIIETGVPTNSRCIQSAQCERSIFSFVPKGTEKELTINTHSFILRSV